MQRYITQNKSAVVEWYSEFKSRVHSQLASLDPDISGCVAVTDSRRDPERTSLGRLEIQSFDTTGSIG